MKPGDTVTLPCTFRRKWWQFWKPRTWTVERTFTVTHVSKSAPVSLQPVLDVSNVDEMLRFARQCTE